MLVWESQVGGCVRTRVFEREMEDGRKGEGNRETEKHRESEIGGKSGWASG